MSHEQLRANDLAQLKCASSWLTALLLKSESYNLSKREFFDTLALRYIVTDGVYVDYQPIVLVERNLLMITDFPVLWEDTFT